MKLKKLNNLRGMYLLFTAKELAKQYHLYIYPCHRCHFWHLSAEPTECGRGENVEHDYLNTCGCADWYMSYV